MYILALLHLRILCVLWQASCSIFANERYPLDFYLQVAPAGIRSQPCIKVWGITRGIVYFWFGSVSSLHTSYPFSSHKQETSTCTCTIYVFGRATQK